MNTIIKGGQLHVYFLHNCTLSRCFISNATKLPSSSTRTLITTCSWFYRFCPGEISQYSSSLWYCYDEHWYKINFHISAHSYDTLYVYIWINSIIRICVGEIVGKLWRATMQKKKRSSNLNNLLIQEKMIFLMLMKISQSLPFRCFFCSKEIVCSFLSLT